MYQVDKRDIVVELDDIPKPDVGAPLPAIVASKDHLELLYIVSEPEPSWDGSSVRVVGANTDGELVATVRFKRPYAHMFGPPNDEAFEGHPLSGRGLSRYATFEVRDSSWVRRLERMNAVHPHHNPKRFRQMRHFIFTFHDTTFECIARSYAPRQQRGSVSSLASTLPRRWE